MIYPTKCGICGRIDKQIICSKCFLELQKELKSKIVKQKGKYFKERLYLFEYKGIIKQKMLQYKFKDKPYLYKLFYEIIKRDKKIYNFLKNYDIIISVPIHYYRKIKRGYNQSDLIIKNIEEICDLKYYKDVLFRTKNLKPQSKLNKEQRKKNIKNVYKIKKLETIKNKNVIVFDDIYTTR